MKVTINKVLIIQLAVFLLIGCTGQKNKKPVDYVNPYIGNISHLLVPTYPTVHLPNSMLRVYPERADYTTETIKGLPIAVTSHRGSSAFCINPYQGDVDKLQPVMYYSYDQEKISPYRYSVLLDQEDIAVDYAPSFQSAAYSLKFSNSEEDKYVTLSVNNGTLSVTNNGTVEGFQYIDNTPTRIYLYLESEVKPEKTGVLSGNKIAYDKESTEKANQAVVLKFKNVGQTINIRYGISFISTEQAKKNLRREINTYNVDQVAEAGKQIWNETLGSIQVEGNENDKIIFYTSLYRTYERMINISEDGQYYSAYDGNIHNDEGTPFYVDDWIWDTYRATHPLRILIEPEKELDMIKSYIRMAEQSENGWLPTFPEITGDTHRMNGNHSIIAFCDAYAKGMTGFDLQKLYPYCKSTLLDKSILPWTRTKATELDEFYRTKGYFPALHEGETETIREVSPSEKRQAVAITLGASYDDWCLSKLAKTLGKEDDYEYFLKSSYNYRNLFNDTTKFFHPKDKNGSFIYPFDYSFSGGQGGREYYDENNGWVYRWDVPHNINDLIELMGGEEQFAANLDQTFRQPLGMEKFIFYRKFPDHTGNVGQFSMANEPSMHIPYLYNYANQPWKTQKCVRKMLDLWFRNDLMGVPGDEDGGGLTSFVVFSYMGFYPVTPGDTRYDIGSPLFSYVKIDLKNGKFFEIEAKNCSEENKYIQSATLNGQNWDKCWFDHSDIKDGGKLVLTMGNKKNENWGKSK